MLDLPRIQSPNGKSRVKTILALAFSLATALTLNSQSQEKPEIKVQSGHSEHATSAAFSPDGKYILSASMDPTLKLWDIASGKEIRAFGDSVSGFDSVAFSPDGKYALSGSADKTLKLWSVESGKEIKVFSGHSDWVLSVAFSPDGKYALSGSKDKTLKLWDISSGKVIRTFTGHSDFVNSLAFSPDGKYALSGSADNTLKLWNISSGEELRTFRGNSSAITCLAFSPDGKSALSGSGDATVRLWDIEKGEEVKTLKGHYWAVLSVAFSPDGKYALSASYDNAFKLWDISSGKEIRTFRGHSKSVPSASISPDGKYVLFSSWDRSLDLLDTASGEEIQTFVGRSSWVVSVAFSPDGKYALSGSYDNTVKLWDIVSGKEVKVFRGHSALVFSVAFSPDGKYALSGSFDKTLRLWDIASGKEIKEILAGNGNYSVVTSVAFSPDGKYALSGSYDKTLKLWDIASGKEIRGFGGHSAEILSVAFSPDGKSVLSGSADKTLKLWDILSGKEMMTFRGHADWVLSVAFSPDGKCALSGSADNTLKLWDIATGEEIRTFVGHSNPCISVAFSPDGKYALSGSFDKTLKLWDIASGKETKTFRWNDFAFSSSSIAFSPDGKHVLSGSSDGTMKLWNISSDECIYSALANNNGSQWLIYTPDGYWDGSSGCGDLVAMVRGMAVWNIDQFAVRNNRPDIIIKRAGGSPDLVEYYKNLYDHRLARMKLKESELTSDYRAPRATFASTSQDGRESDLNLCFAADGKDLTSYNIYVNDVPLFGAIGKPLSGQMASLKERIELTPGENKIEVSCMDAGGTESFRVPQYAAWEGKVSRDLYFIGFGVSKYQDSSLDLGYAAKDAKDLSALYQSMEGKGYDRVFAKAYADDEVTPQAIKDAKSILSNAKPEDTFVLFIAGHGVHDNDKNRTYYFLTHDADRENLFSTAANFDTIEDLLQNIAPRQKLFLMDTCESGENSEGPQTVAGAITIGSKSRGLIAVSINGNKQQATKAVKEAYGQRDRYIYNDLIRRSGAIVFSSCKGSEASWEFDDLANGVFTAAIKACYGDSAADVNHDGILSTDELRAYVTAKASQLVLERTGFDLQHPTVDRDNLFAKFGFPLLKE